MKLESLQTDFIAAIFNQDRESAIEYVEGDQRLDASERLGIYRGSVHGILTQSLTTTYPVCNALLGEEFFDKMCDRFIDQHPPSTPFFSHYGDQLALFLSDFEPVKTIPFIADVAAFEWARHTLWQQTNREPFDFSQLEKLTEEQQAKIIFHLTPTLHLFSSDYRIDHIWFAHQQDSDIRFEDIDVESDIKLLMWKGDNAIKIADLESEQIDGAKTQEYWDFLSAVSNNLNITELASKFEEVFPILLNKSIQDGWIDSFSYD